MKVCALLSNCLCLWCWVSVWWCDGCYAVLLMMKGQAGDANDMARLQ